MADDASDERFRQHEAIPVPDCRAASLREEAPMKPLFVPLPGCVRLYHPGNDDPVFHPGGAIAVKDGEATDVPPGFLFCVTDKPHTECTCGAYALRWDDTAP